MSLTPLTLVWSVLATLFSGCKADSESSQLIVAPRVRPDAAPSPMPASTLDDRGPIAAALADAARPVMEPIVHRVVHRAPLSQDPEMIVYRHESSGCGVTVSRNPKLTEVKTVAEALEVVVGARADEFIEALAVDRCRGTCELAQPQAIALHDDFSPDVWVGGMLVRWTPTQTFALPHRFLVFRTFQCLASASASTTLQPEFWASVEGMQMRGEGDGWDPLLDDGCSVGCASATRSVLDFMVDPEGVGGTLLIERLHDVQGADAQPRVGHAIEVRYHEAEFVLSGCGADFRIQWPPAAQLGSSGP